MYLIIIFFNSETKKMDWNQHVFFLLFYIHLCDVFTENNSSLEQLRRNLQKQNPTRYILLWNKTNCGEAWEKIVFAIGAQALVSLS